MKKPRTSKAKEFIKNLITKGKNFFKRLFGGQAEEPEPPKVKPIIDDGVTEVNYPRIKIDLSKKPYKKRPKTDIGNDGTLHSRVRVNFAKPIKRKIEKIGLLDPNAKFELSIYRRAGNRYDGGYNVKESKTKIQLNANQMERYLKLQGDFKEAGFNLTPLTPSGLGLTKKKFESLGDGVHSLDKGFEKFMTDKTKLLDRLIQDKEKGWKNFIDNLIGNMAAYYDPDIAREVFDKLYEKGAEWLKNKLQRERVNSGRFSEIIAQVWYGGEGDLARFNEQIIIDFFGLDKAERKYNTGGTKISDDEVKAMKQHLILSVGEDRKKYGRFY